MYIWQAAGWPQFEYDKKQLESKLANIEILQTRLLGQVQDMPESVDKEAQMDALIQNAIRTSAIEGEMLDVGSVRSSVARHLGLNKAGMTGATKQTEALVEMLVDATENLSSSLSVKQLCKWQSLLFPETPLLHKLIVGELRGEEPMQVISQQGRRQIVHFEAPGRELLDAEIDAFLNWFNQPLAGNGAIRAGIAHLWFVTLHPFGDGNGRLTRAITDRALAQVEDTSTRFYSMSAAIETRRGEYYDQLEKVQNVKAQSQQSGRSPLNITSWLDWFLDVLIDALESGMVRIERVLAKSKYWYRHSQTVLSERQIKVLNRLLDNYGDEFVDGINASKYQSLAKVSKATATRDLTLLFEKGCLKRSDAGGRSTRYVINYDGLKL
ncbi:Fic family protein [Thalassotalea mangrovi]|uniref:Fic family protein n=1 Tax=Thalassotalea mangrovi TaxID=2572245 RepID=A0A4U1B6F8_9GAMM|nr:Fic family protein [Thalassotalea mangrovi]TKB46124.1 Fic family protein [Thalassotalea mangrovi]